MKKIDVGWLGPSARKKYNIKIGAEVSIANYIGNYLKNNNVNYPIGSFGIIKSRYNSSLMVDVDGTTFQVTAVFVNE